MNGVINVYKEKGFTSFDVCAKLRGILKTRKIGHTGTLDPDAEGVLPVCVGNATKLCDLLTDKDKVYEAVLYLGRTTDTEDMSGMILEEKELVATKDEVEDVIMSFQGTYEQVPPMYSAIKVNGQRLYDLARQGKTVERKARTVTIHSIQILEYIMEEEEPSKVRKVRMSVVCSKGTYIRTLCKDIGERLLCGGCMEQLLRTRVSIFEIKDSLKLSEIEERAKKDLLDSIVYPVDSLFPNFAKAVVSAEHEKYLYNGNVLKQTQLIFSKHQFVMDSEEILVYDSKNCFTGIYSYWEAEQLYKPVKMFL